MTDDKAASGAHAARELRDCGALDGLFAQIREGSVSLTGQDGLLPALLKESLEAGLRAELDDHLGYDKGEPTTVARGNARNGTTPKTIDSEVGPFDIEVPRDRAGSFTPRLVRKGQRRLDGLDSMIISLYAGGIETCATSPTTCAKPWRSTCRQPRSPRSPTRCARRSWPGRAGLWKPSTRWSTWMPSGSRSVRGTRSPTGPPTSPSVRGMEGVKHVLGIWVQADEAASFWAHVCSDLANRGVSDVLIVCRAGWQACPRPPGRPGPTPWSRPARVPPDPGLHAVCVLR